MPNKSRGSWKGKANDPEYSTSQQQQSCFPWPYSLPRMWTWRTGQGVCLDKSWFVLHNSIVNIYSLPFKTPRQWINWELPLWVKGGRTLMTFSSWRVLSIVSALYIIWTKLFLEFCHTGDLESLNALLLKYAKKTHAYRQANCIHLRSSVPV